MSTRDSALPLLARCLEAEVESGTALGATARVVYHGEVIFDFACGLRDGHRPLSLSDDVPWYSASKIASSVAVARAWELGLFDIDRPVSAYVPEFAGAGKETITGRQLWTHKAPLQEADRSVNTSMSWSEAIERICATAADDGAETGRGGYLGHAGMLLLGEIVARRSGTGFADFFDQEVAGPLRLRSRVGPPTVAGDLVNVPFIRSAPTMIAFSAAAGFPGNCVTGPIGDAAVLCQLLLDGGTFDGRAVLQPETVAALTACQHSSSMDQRLGMPVTTGLGLALDEFSFGRYCSANAFGHSGARSSVAFGDPDADLSVAIFFNGTCPFRVHVRRINEASGSVYLDLGLAEPSDPGRDHPAPFGILV